MAATRSPTAHFVYDRRGKSGSLGWVGAGAQFVKKHKTFSVAHLEYLDYIRHVRRKVESDCSMLCSSPMSTSMRSKTATLLSSAAGIIIPHIVISVKSPSVLRLTVFPPVLGPRYDQRVKILSKPDVGGHHLLGSIRG